MIAIIGCGNLNRSDDGVGVEVVRTLLARGLSRDANDVLLLDAGSDGTGVMFAARGCQTLIVVDSCRTGAEPGAVFEMPGAVLQRPPEPSFNLHDFRWDHALYAGRKIFGADFPVEVLVLLIEARSLVLGIGLSAEVARAATKVADRITQLVSERRQLAARS